MTGFFEAEDFKNEESKGLVPKYYPSKYKKYIKEEAALLKSKLRGNVSVLEAGTGIGRLIPVLAPIVKELVGVDNSDFMIRKSSEIAKRYTNARIIKADLHYVSKSFPRHYFDFATLVWNTLGNVKNEAKVLRELSKITKTGIFVTVFLKGTLEDRKKWYKSVGVKIREIDKKKEVFFSESGLESKAYNLGIWKI